MVPAVTLVPAGTNLGESHSTTSIRILNYSCWRWRHSESVSTLILSSALEWTTTTKLCQVESAPQELQWTAMSEACIRIRNC